MNPNLVKKLSYALGCCYFNMGRFSQAKKIFNSIAKSESLESEGYLGLAIVEKKQKNYKSYFEYLEKAYTSSQKNPQVMLELAEHYMFKDDFERAVKIARYGLICSEKLQHAKTCKFKSKTRKDYNEMKSRFSYIIANRYHHQVCLQIFLGLNSFRFRKDIKKLYIITIFQFHSIRIISKLNSVLVKST